MLYSLTISNYILIGSLETTFPEGLIIISGETGAGKSILLGALSLVLGAKADPSMVGSHGDNCVVEAEFGVDEDLRVLLRQADLPDEGDRLVLRRTVARSGRSRCFAGDEPVSMGVLQELARHLVDIHSQHQTLRLADERFRLDALDLWGGCRDLRQECAEAWRALGESRHTLSALEERLARAQEEQEYNQARWERLDQARLTAGELEALEIEQKQLSHAEQIKETLCRVQELLAPETGETPAQQLREAARLTEKAGAYIPDLQPLVERLTSARLELEDIAQDVTAANDRTEVSPQRLEAVEERLSLLYGLLHKHNAENVEALMAERDRLEGLVLDASELVGEVEKARRETERLSALHERLCAQLHRHREDAATGFSAAVQKQLQALDLEQAIFRVPVDSSAPGALGSDTVRFLFSANGKNLSDVGKTASGGELSRMMLAIKAVMARYTQMPTLIFDEIDSGVSGSTADKMGSLVCEMGQDMQVFAITHLPQVAAKGNAHYLVSKSADGTTVQCLDYDGRVRELARMLSGASITAAAIANAKTLLNP